MKKFERLSQINEKYAMNFDERELTKFEKIILNSPTPINYLQYDLNNIEIVNSLSIYYDIELNKPGKEMKGSYTDNLKHFMFINKRLTELGSSKGAMRIGAYYLEEKNYEEAEKYFIISLNINDEDSIYSMLNLRTLYIQQDQYDKAFPLFDKCFKLGNFENMIQIIGYYSTIKDYINILKWIEYGLYKSQEDCLEALKMCNFNVSLLYCYLLKLPFTNDFIENAKRDCIPRINQDIVDDCRRTNKYIIAIEDQDYIIGSSVELIEIYG